MSETAPQKLLLLDLLKKVIIPIANGEDKNHVLPGAEGYDAESAPTMPMRWCASTLRIVIMRVVEYVVKFRKDIEELKATTKDLPEMRAQVKEMLPLLQEIVMMAKAASGGQEAPPAGDTPPSDNGERVESAEQIAER